MNQLTPLATFDQLAAPAPIRGPQSLTRKQKAAIVVRLMVAKGAEVPLAELPESLQAELAQQIGTMSYVDRDTLAQVVEEFAAELESVGLAFPGGLAGALSALDGQISPQTAARLRKEAGVRQAGDPWERISNLEADELVEIVERESPEVASVVLSKLAVARAAEVLGKLPGETARRLTYAISQTAEVTPDAVYRIGLSLATQLDDVPEKAFGEEPVKRVGDILNFSPAGTRDEVLAGLEEDDKPFADAVRKAIFTFAHLAVRIDPRDVPKILRDVEQEDLITALAASTEAPNDKSRDFLLENMSKRMADQLREQIEERGEVKEKDGEAAMTAVVLSVRGLIDAGELLLRDVEEEEEG